MPIIKLPILLPPKPCCCVCGKEVEDWEFIDGPDIYICSSCCSEWNERCYKLLDQMKEEKKK